MNSNHTQPPSPKAIRGVERDKGRAKIEKWFHDEKRQEDELPILSYIAQNVNLNAGGGDTAQGMASELLRSLLTRLGIDYHHDAQTLKDRAKEFSKKPGYNQRYHNMGVIQYFQHAAEFILFGTVWDPSFPAAVHLTGNTILSVEKDVIDGLTGDAAKKFATEVTAAKGGRPHVKLWKYVLYVLKPTWAAKGLQPTMDLAFKAVAPGKTWEVLTDAGKIAELAPEEARHGPGFNRDVGMTKKGWVALELMHLLWEDMESATFEKYVLPIKK